MQSADHRFGDDPAGDRRLDLSVDRGIAVVLHVAARFVVVDDVAMKQGAEVVFAQDDDVVEKLASNAPDQSFDVRVLPGRSWSGEDFLDVHGLELGPIGSVVVADQASGHLVERERVSQLLGDPFRGGGRGDVEVKDASAVVREDDEPVEQMERHGGHDEEVDGDERADVVFEESSPGLRRRFGRGACSVRR
jgi:hypothetical protein